MILFPSAGLYSLDVEDYEVVTPRKVTEDGRFLSHDLDHHYTDDKGTDGGHKTKRSVGAVVNYHIALGLLGHEQALHLQLWPSRDFLAPGLVVERRADNSTPRRSPPSLVATHCHYQGTIRGQPGSQVAMSACNGLVSDSNPEAMCIYVSMYLCSRDGQVSIR
jgi:hypothetical protein